MMQCCVQYVLILGFAVMHLLFMPQHASSVDAIKIGSMENYAPYNFTSADGRYTGIDVAIIETVLQEMGLPFTHHPRPWQRALVEFESGDLDMLFQLKPSPERFEKWHMAGPIRPNNRGYFVAHDSPIQDIVSPDHLKGLRIGIIRGYEFSDAFTEAMKTSTVEEVSTIEQNVLKLVAGRLDVVIENVIPFKYELRNMGFNNQIRVLPTLAEQGERYVAFQKTERGERLAKMFQKKLDELIAKGTIQTILGTWEP